MDRARDHWSRGWKRTWIPLENLPGGRRSPSSRRPLGRGDPERSSRAPGVRGATPRQAPRGRGVLRLGQSSWIDPRGQLTSLRGASLPETVAPSSGVVVFGLAFPRERRESAPVLPWGRAPRARGTKPGEAKGLKHGIETAKDIRRRSIRKSKQRRPGGHEVLRACVRQSTGVRGRVSRRLRRW